MKSLDMMFKKAKEILNPTKYYLLTIFTYLISRHLFYQAGINIDKEFFPWSSQFIGELMIKEELLKSIFYSYVEPPLYNLIPGAIYLLFPESHDEIYSIGFQACGLIMALAMFQLMVELGLSKRFSFIATTIFICSPAAICYENYSSYTYPVAMLQVLTALALILFLKTGKTRYAFGFSLSLALMILTRGSYHLIWYIGILSLIAAYRRVKYREFIKAVWIPVAIILLVCLKNYVVFDEFKVSNNLIGMNLAQRTVMRLPMEERQMLVKAGKISPLSTMDMWLTGYHYRPYFPNIKPRNILILDADYKQQSVQNMHSLVYIYADRYYLKDAIYALLNRPQPYILSLPYDYLILIKPADDYSWLNWNRDKIKDYERAYNVGFLGQFLPPEYEMDDKNLKSPIDWYLQAIMRNSLFIFFGLPLVILFGVSKLLWAWIKGDLARPETFTIAYMTANVAYVSLVSMLAFGFPEYNRGRYEVDPLIFIMGILLIKYVFSIISCQKNDKKLSVADSPENLEQNGLVRQD